MAKRKGPAELPPHRIETRRVADLTPAAYNPRKINPEALAGLIASVERFGAVQPIIVNERTGHIVGGHQRLKALQQLGQTETTVVVVDLSEPDERALNVTLNNPHIAGEFSDGLGALLDTISGESPGLFSDLRLDALLADAPTPTKKGNSDPDDVPEPPPDPVTRAGDVWVLGGHRIICGDSTDAATVARLLGGGLAGMVFTDPPYGVEFQSRMSKGGTATRFAKLQNDDVILPVAPVVWQAMAEDTAAFVWTSQAVYPVWREQFSAFYKSTIIWHKPGGGIGDLEGDYAGDYEMALFCVKGRPKFRGKRGMAVWKIAKDSAESYLHPTQKPVELAERAIADFSDAGDVVLDLFSGSGSTLIACERTSRRARVSELDPAYADVGVSRWQTFTGKQATLDGDGRTFAEVAAERATP